MNRNFDVRRVKSTNSNNITYHNLLCYLSSLIAYILVAIKELNLPITITLKFIIYCTLHYCIFYTQHPGKNKINSWFVSTETKKQKQTFSSGKVVLLQLEGSCNAQSEWNVGSNLF